MSYLQDELDKSIENEEQLSKTSIERSEALDISDALKCHRMRYLKYYALGGKDYSGSSLRTFMLGRVAEKVIVNYLRFRGVIVKKAQYLKHYLDPRIRGKTDFTINKYGLNYVAELKSYDGWGFFRRKKDPEAISKLHEAQGLNYVDILLQSGEQVEDKAIIVEASRDNLNIIETETRPIEEMRETLHNDWKTLITAIDTKTIPPVLEDFPSGKECKYCSRKDKCKELNSG